MTGTGKRVLRVANIVEEGKLGGPQLRILRLAKHLGNEVETTVVLPRSNSEKFRSILEKEDILYHTLFLSRVTKELRIAIQYVLCSLFETLLLYIYLKKEAFDIVHASGGAWQYKGVIAGKLAGCKVIWHLNDTSLPDVFLWLFRQLSSLPDYFIFSSNKTKLYYRPLIKNSKTPGALIRQPVETQKFKPRGQPIMNNGRDEQFTETITIGTIANINPVKRLELFILVASHLNNEHDNLRFCVVGPVYNNQEKYFLWLKEYAKQLGVSNIVFKGESSNVQDELSCFDIFLCTSINESGPLTLWEAMSMKKAVVSTDVGDVGEFLCSGISGDVVAVDDSIAMSKRVSRLIKDGAARRRYGEEASQVIVNNFDVDLCAARQLSVYRELTAHTH